MSTNYKFKTFDFKNNENWQEYKRKITVTNNSNAKFQYKKLKMKWYKQNIDPSFDLQNYTEWEDSSASKTTQQEKPSQTPPHTQSSSVPDPQYSPKGFFGDFLQNFLYSSTMTDNLLRAANLWTVILYVSFFATFFLRIPLGVYFWQYATVASLIAYAVSLKSQMTYHWPQTMSFQSVLQTLTILSQLSDFQYCFYCFTLLYAQHVSLVAITPLAIYAFYHSVTFLGPVLSLFKNYNHLGKIPDLIQNSTNYQTTLAYWAAVCEILTFPILLWRYFMGLNHDILLVHLFLMYQFLSQRYRNSRTTKEILSNAYNTARSYFPVFPSAPQ